MLVRELHRDAASKGLPDHRRPVYPKLIEQIAQPHREGAQRVVATRFRGLAVAQ